MTGLAPGWVKGVPRPKFGAWPELPRLIVNDACSANGWTPTTGTNPTPGTGGFTSGDVDDLGDLLIARSTFQYGPNASTINVTNASSTVASNKLTVAGNTYTNGMAVIPSNLGTTTLPAATNADGSYYVVGVSGNDLQLALTSGGTAIVFGGSNSTNIHLTAIAMNAGNGAYRWSTPYLLIDSDRALLRVTGIAQLYDDTIAKQDFGVDPGEYLTASLHTAPSLNDGSTVGMVLAHTLPLTQLQGGYPLTHHTVDVRNLDETAVSNPPTQAEVIATRQYVNTVVADLVRLLAQNVSINVGHAVPWAWGPNYRLEALMIYRAATS